MTSPTIQMPTTFKGKQYSGIYSVNGTLVIARVPGVGSKARELEGEETDIAQDLINEILQEAEQSGMLDWHS